MSNPNIILIGAGRHSRACIDVIEQNGQYHIAGLVGLDDEMHTQRLGYAVIATDAELRQLAKDNQCALVAVGQVHSPDTRIRLYHRAVELGFSLPSIIAPTAHVATHATIDAGTTVMHGAIINSGARVGKN